MKLKLMMACALVTLLSANTSFGEIVYETLNTVNTTNMLGFDENSAGGTQLAGNATAELGDRITLGGTARSLTGGSTRWLYYGGGGKNSPTYTSNIKLSFYNDVDGDAIPDGAAFYTQDIVGPTFNSGVISNPDISWTMPNVTVPDDFIFTFHMNDQDSMPYDSDSNVYGPRARLTPNQVGSDSGPGSPDNYVWRQNGSGTWNYGTYPFLYGGNIRLTLEATEVPEPSSIVLAGLGAVGVGLTLIRRRRRKQAK